MKGFCPIKLINTSITLHICLPCPFFLVRTFKFYFLTNFSYKIVLSVVVTMLYLRSSNLIHLITESLDPFTNLYFHQPLAPIDHLSTLLP